MAQTIVDICELLFRNKKRVTDNIKQYLNNKITNKAPRQPDIRKYIYVENLKKIIGTLKNIMNKKKICSSTHSNECIRILIFDNNSIYDDKNNYGLLYDSKDNNINKGIESIERYNVDNIENCNNYGTK